MLISLWVTGVVLSATLAGCGGDPGTDDDDTNKEEPSGSGGGSSGGSEGTGEGSGGAPGATGGSGNGSGGSDLGSGGSGDGAGGSFPAVGSPGCGSLDAPESGTHQIEQSTGQRSFILSVPDNYDPNHQYPIVFGWHWRGGNAGEVANGQGASFGPYYGLEELAEGSMIFVAPEGLVDNNVTGWANPGGRDITFAEALLDHLEQELCIDTERIFSTGFSFGGMFSNAVGCALPDRFRAVAPISGSLWSGCEGTDTPIAYLGIHGVDDEVVEIEPGREARDEFLGRNACGSTTVPDSPDGCVAYEGCAAGAPLVWCEYPGGHWPPNFATDRIWDFFTQF